MRLAEIVGIFKQYFEFALVLFLVGAGAFLLFYFLYYRKKYKLNVKKLLVNSLFIIYLLMVAGVTFLNRGANFEGSVNLSFLYTYREAWNNYSLRNFQGIFLNILMFMPLGFLLPLVWKKINSYKAIFILSLVTSLLIELIQLIFRIGIFDITDLFHNVIGALIGFGLIRWLQLLIKKQWKKSFVHLVPLAVIVMTFVGVLSYYEWKDYGNLPINYTKKQNIKGVQFTSNLNWNETASTAAVYKAPSISKQEAKSFVEFFYKNFVEEDINLEIIDYQTTGLYWHRGEPTYSMWVNYLDSTYTMSNYAVFKSELEPKESEEKALRNTLLDFGIYVPEYAIFEEQRVGSYIWTVDKLIDDVNHSLMDGQISVNYYSNDQIMNISNMLVTYEKVKEEPIISEKEAYEQLISGEFQLYLEEIIYNIDIKEIALSYHLDTKGFYQPIYEFSCLVNGEDRIIRIPALK